GCLLEMGKPAESAEASRKASDLIQKLVDDSPAVPRLQLQLVEIQNDLGRALDRQKRLAEAFTALEKGLVVAQKLANDNPENADYTAALGASYTCRGGARARAGQPAEAAADLRRALELWARLPPLEVGAQVERSRALALLAGLGGDAKSGVTKDEARTFADQSVAALADAVKTGWGNPSELKEPDFDALRGGAGFHKLLAGGGATAVPESKAKREAKGGPPRAGESQPMAKGGRLGRPRRRSAEAPPGWCEQGLQGRGTHEERHRSCSPTSAGALPEARRGPAGEGEIGGDHP